MKKRIISILASFVSTKTNEKIENSQIFNLFFRMKRSSLGKTEEENPILKYMDFKKESFFPKINEIKNKNKGKKAKNLKEFKKFIMNFLNQRKAILLFVMKESPCVF